MSLFAGSKMTAAVEKVSTRLVGSNIYQGNFLSVLDNKYPNVTMSGDAIVNYSVGKITLGIDYTIPGAYSISSFNFDYYVVVSTTYAYANGTTGNIIQKLKLDYKSSNSVNIDKSIGIIKGAHVLSIVVDHFENSTGGVISSPTIPLNLYLEAEIETERFYKLDETIPPTASHILISGSNELEVYWNSIVGAEEYELEWTYVNNYDNTSDSYDYQGSGAATINTIAYSTLDFTFLNNSTRIRTSKNSFKIGLNYNSGLIVYRIRAIGKDISDIAFEKIGDWSFYQPQTTSSYKLSGLSSFDDYYVITNSHEENKNWQYTATYAEGGLKKEVVKYFDGSLRNRQSVTKTNTEDISIIAETIYDKQGRATVQILPTPSKLFSNQIKYYENFNQSKTFTSGLDHLPFGRADIELTTSGSCPHSPGPLYSSTISSTGEGAGIYYSPYNTKKDNQDAYIPDAKEYPYTTTIYTPDNTGRIKYQSGVGVDHKIGSDHETKYLYGDPDQQDIDKLFGSEAGYAERYKKNMVIDPNGQISVSYLNTENKTVATALAGNSPLNLSSIGQGTYSINSSYFDYNDANYDQINKIGNNAVVFGKKIIPNTTGTYTLAYTLLVPSYTDECIPNFCYDCVYDLDINIKDECQNSLYSNVKKVGLNSENILDYTCDASPITYSTETETVPFSVYLHAGKEYFLTKTLSVNNTALLNYAAHYTDTTKYEGVPNNICTETLHSFMTLLTASVSTLGCDMTCERCDSLLTIYYASHNDADKADVNSLNYDPTYIYMTPAQKALSQKKCYAPCTDVSMCKAQFGNLLQDISPNGQYAQYNIGGSGFDASSYELSIFNDHNKLPLTNQNCGPAGGSYTAFNVTYDIDIASWKHPEYYNEYTYDFTSPNSVDTKSHYFNEDGTIGKVRLTKTSSGFQPAIATTSYTYTDAIGVWTYPENLANVSDFANAYISNPHWAYSLVKYHPEFNYFLDCSRQSNPSYFTTGTTVFTSENYDELLRRIDSYSAAKSSSNPFVLTDDNVINDLLDADPYFNSSSIYGISSTDKAIFKGLLEQFINTGSGAWMSIKGAAAAMHTTGNMFYAACSPDFGNTSITCSGTSFAVSTQALDNMWKAYRELYLIEKNKFLTISSQLLAAGISTLSGSNSNYYNGAIGEHNFSVFNAYINYSFSPFYPFTSFSWVGSGPTAFDIQYNSFFYPDCASGYSPIFSSYYYPTFGAYGFYDFGAPSSTYHYKKYENKVRRFPDQQTLNNSLAGGASDPSSISSALENNSNKDVQLNTGECPDYKRLELFLQTVVKNGSLLDGAQHGLVNENSFTKNLYDQVLACSSYMAGEWHPLDFKGTINTTTQALTLNFYDGSTIISGSSIVLSPPSGSGFTSWAYVKMLSSIHFLGNNSSNDVFTINALYDDGVLQPYTIILNGTTSCIINNCVPPESISCKPTQQALEIVKFLSAVVADKQSGATFPVDLSDYSFYSSQNFSGQVRFPYGTTTIATGTHFVDFDPTSNILGVTGPNSGISGGNISALFQFTPNNSGDDLNGAIGFTNIIPKQSISDYYDFSIKAVYSSGGVTTYKTFYAKVDYYEGTTLTNDCGESASYACRKYKFGQCDEIVSSECQNNPEYVLSQDFLNFLNVNLLSDARSISLIPLNLMSDYSGLIQSAVGSSATDVNQSLSAVYNSTTAVTSFTSTLNFINNSVTPSTTICAIPMTYTVPGDQTTGLSSSIISAAEIKVLDESLHKFEFMLLMTDGNDIKVTAYAPCLNMQNCESCPYDSIIYKEDFDTYTSSTTSSGLHFTSDYLYAGSNYTSVLRGMDKCLQTISPASTYGDYTITDYASTTGICNLTYDHTTINANRNYLNYKIADAGTYANRYDIYISDPITTTPGKQYEFSAYYRSFAFDNTEPASVEIILAINNGISDIAIASKVTDCGNGWTKIKGLVNGSISPLTLKIISAVAKRSRGISSASIYVTIDDILLQEKQCEAPPIYSIPTGLPPENDCKNQMVNINLSNAQQAFVTYLDDVKKDFERRYTEKCLQSLETLAAQYTSSEGHYTLYYYDQAGNLIKTVPPEGVEQINLSATTSEISPLTGAPITYGGLIKADRANQTQNVFTTHRLATHYEYNSLNQLIKQSSPDHTLIDQWITSNNSGIPSGLQSYGMDFFDSEKGYLAGHDGTNGLLYTTQDGGQTWAQVTSIGLHDILDIEVNGSKAFAISSDGSLLTSNNYNTGSPTWNTENLGSSNLMRFNDIDFISSTVGYIVGESDLVLETTDGGTTWSPLTLSSGNNLTRITHRTDVNGTYVVITGTGGLVLYKKSTGSWLSYTSISSAIDLKDATIVSNGDASSTWLNVIVCGVDNGASPLPAASAIQLVDINSSSPSLSGIGFTAVSTTDASAFNKIVAHSYTTTGPVTNTEYFFGGVTQSTPPRPLFVKLATTSIAFPYTSGLTETDLSSSLPDGEITGLQIKTPGGIVATDVIGTINNTQIFKYNATTPAATAYNLTTTGTVYNTAPLNGLWLNPSNTNEGIAVGNNGTIIKFTDGGSSFTSASLNVVLYPKLHDIVSLKTPVTLGRVYAVGDHGTILYSSDYGSTWEYIATSITNDLYSIGLGSHHPEPATLLMGGTGGSIFKMQASTYGIGAISISGSATYYAIKRQIDLYTSVLVGEDSGGSGVITLCNAMGEYVISNTSTTYGLRDITFVQPNLAYIVGKHGTILKSTDDGITFSTLTSGTTENLNSVVFIDQLTGYAFGENNTILKTIDGGASWVLKPAPTGTGINIQSASNLGNNHIIVAGVGTPNLFDITDPSNNFSSRFYYDALGRLIISQNSKQYAKTTKAYSYTIYDDIGRIKQVGEIAGSSLPDPFALTNNNGVISISDFTAWLALGNKSEVTSTLYDVSATTGLCTLLQNNLRKRVSATYLDTDDDLGNGYSFATYYSYDIHGNVKNLINEDPAMPTGHTCKKIEYSYDLISGKVLSVSYQKGQPDEFNHKYEYDADNRITNALTSKDGYSWEQDAKYFYYKHGPLARVEMGQEKVQGLDYAYTLQGWIKGINSSNLSETTDIGKDGATGTTYNSTIADLNKHISKDAASYSLNYFDNDYAAIDAAKNLSSTRFDAGGSSITALTTSTNWLYNGNISSMGTTIKNPVSPGTALPQLTAYKYDQLNRIKEMTAYAGITSNAWSGSSSDLYKNEFAYDANGNIQTQNRYDASGTQIEGLTYRYHTDGSGKKISNRLYHVNDAIGTTTTTDDIEDQGSFTSAPGGRSLGSINTANNYSYDEIGNLTKDASEGIDNIEWNVYGKISSITRASGYYKTIGGVHVYPDNLVFLYDASGNRIEKIVKPRDASGEKASAYWKHTYYTRDAQGNVMAVYKKETTFDLTEHHIYGSSRLGMQTYTGPDNVSATSVYTTTGTNYVQERYAGNKSYEISNHLGNVLSTVSDRKIEVDANSDNIVDYYAADITSSTDYNPFGVAMNGRKFNAPNYRYGMNGQEKDDEIASGIYTAEYWEYDSRLGRRWNTDPVVKPWESPYACFANSPVWFSDVNGDDATENGDKGKGKAPKVDNTPDPQKKPGEIWGDEVPVIEKRTFIDKVKNFFNNLGDKIPGAITKYENKMLQSIRNFFNKPFWHPAKWFDKTRDTEANANSNTVDTKKKSPDVEGDGKLEHGGGDSYDDPSAKTSNSQNSPDALDNDNWTIRPDASGHQQKKVNSDDILYRSQKTKDTIMIWTPTKTYTNKNSEGWKEKINEIK